MGIIKTRDAIYAILRDVGITSIAYGFNQDLKTYPRATFFQVSTVPITASNNEFQTNRSYQISIFLNKLDEQLLSNIKHSLRAKCFMVDDWQDMSIFSENSEIYHMQLEFSFVDDDDG